MYGCLGRGPSTVMSLIARILPVKRAELGPFLVDVSHVVLTSHVMFDIACAYICSHSV